MKAIKLLVEKFENIKGTSFVGIREYLCSTSGELANHVINVGFSYKNAIIKDLNRLMTANENDINCIAIKSNLPIDLIKTAIDKLIKSFEKNLNPETQSNQSKGQIDAYMPICNCIKLHLETMKFHIYALAVSKDIIIASEYKTVNSNVLTLAQNAIKKYFDFSTSKYRNYIVDEAQLSSVAITGDTININ